MSLVLVGVDNSVYSEHAFDVYIKNFHKPGHKVEVVHCPEDWHGVRPMEGPTPGRLHELQQEADQNSAAIKDKYEQLMRAKGVTGEFKLLRGKQPWEAIHNKAKKESANLIVVGTRGTSSIRRTLLGSTSDSLVHHAHCPVLVCPKEEDRHKHHHHH